MTPHEFGKKCAHDFLTKYARKGDPGWGDFLGELGQSFNPWNGREVGGVGSYIDKWYNPWTQNTDPMSRGEAPLMWLGRGAMGTGAAAGTAAGGLMAAGAPAFGIGGAGAGTAATATTAAGRSALALRAAEAARAARAAQAIRAARLARTGATTAANTAGRVGWGRRLWDALGLATVGQGVYNLAGGGNDADGQQQQQQQQPQVAGVSPLNTALLGGLAGAGVGGLAGYFNPGEEVITAPDGMPMKRKRKPTSGALRGAGLGGLAGLSLGGMYGAATSPAKTAAYAFGARYSQNI